MIEHPPLISVVMPAYNAEKYLAEAIDSILTQTFTDFELIIIDDGSTDQTPAIIKRYKEQDSRISAFFLQKNMGIAAALNQGLSVARGKYLARMDADDISLPERFAKQAAFMEAHPAVGVLGTAAIVIDSAGRHHQTLVFPTSHLLLLWSLCFYSPIIHPSVMARREVILSAGGYLSTTHTEDYELWGRLSTITQFANLAERLLLLRKSGTNVSTRYSKNFLDDGIIISKSMFHKLIGLDLPATPFELTLQPRRIPAADLRQIMEAMISLLDHFLHMQEITPQEKHYLRQETALRLFRLLPSSTFNRTALDLIVLAFKCEPFALLNIPRLAFHKLISR